MYLEIIRAIAPKMSIVENDDLKLKLLIKKRLTKKEITILEDDHKKITNKETCTKLDITQERLEGLKKSAFRKIRQKVVVDIAQSAKED